MFQTKTKISKCGAISSACYSSYRMLGAPIDPSFIIPLLGPVFSLHLWFGETTQKVERSQIILQNSWYEIDAENLRDANKTKQMWNWWDNAAKVCRYVRLLKNERTQDAKLRCSVGSIDSVTNGKCNVTIYILYKGINKWF